MPRPRPQVCAIPGCPLIQLDRLCPEHKRQAARHHQATTPTAVTRDKAERNRRRAFVEAHRERHGEWCPGYGRPPHTLTPADAGLTADHITPIAHGGHPNGPLQALCRSCNSRKAARGGG